MKASAIRLAVVLAYAKMVRTSETLRKAWESGQEDPNYQRPTLAANGYEEPGYGLLVTQTEAGEKELRLNGYIGEFFGVDPIAFAKAVEEHKPARLLLNSGGGEVFDGLAIADTVRQAKLPVVVVGVAASMGSVIAASSPHLTIRAGAQLMIHEAWSGCAGNAKMLRHEADALDKATDSLLEAYAVKAKGKTSKDAFRPMLEAETWLTGREAVELGLADVYSPDEDEDTAQGLAYARSAFGLGSVYTKTPETLRAAQAESPEPEEAASGQKPAPLVRVRRVGAFYLPKQS